MAYAYQIRLLEGKLQQLKHRLPSKENLEKMSTIESELKKLRRLEWEEKHERLDLGDDR